MDGSVTKAEIAVYDDIHCYINLPILKNQTFVFQNNLILKND